MSDAPIVVGTDRSSTASRAVDKAGELAAALGAPLHLVMSYKSANASASLIDGGVVIDPVTLDEGSSSHAESVLLRASECLDGIGLRVSHTVVCARDPSDALIALAGEIGAQMIVVGNKGMLGARRVLGSIPNRVSHHAACCVLIVQTC
jgi:nucleotide-binding universal stress UspA family protein